MPLLINRLKPYPFESLSSLLERLRQVNYYEEYHWYHDVLPDRSTDDVDFLRLAANYRVLASLTGISIADLLGLTLHRFVPYVYSAQSVVDLQRRPGDLDRPMWEDCEANLYLHPSSYCKICPHCYRDQGAFLLPWQLRYITSCPIHSVLLVDTCPNCEEPLRVKRSKGTCVHCGCAISTYPTTSIADHLPSMQVTALLWSAIGCGSDSFPPPLPIAPDHLLHSLPPAILLIFLWRSAQLILTRDRYSSIFSVGNLPKDCTHFAPPKRLSSADVCSTHGVLLGMWQLLRYWPDSWHIALDRIVVGEGGSKLPFPSELLQEFVGESWLWLHQTWTTYMRMRIDMIRDLSRWRQYYRVAQHIPDIQIPKLGAKGKTSGLLKKSDFPVKRRVYPGSLHETVCPLSEHNRKWKYIDMKTEFLRLFQKSALSLEEVAGYYGVSEQHIISLVVAGLLDVESGSLVDEKQIWRFTFQMVERTLADLLKPIPVRPLPVFAKDGLWDLKRVQMELEKIHVYLPRLLTLARDGVLPTYRAQDGIGLHLLWWEPSSVRDTVRRLHLAGVPVYLSDSTVCWFLSCKLLALEHLQMARLLAPSRDGDTVLEVRGLYDKRDVLAFLERYISTDEAADVLGVTCLNIRRWAQSGRLATVVGPAVGSSVYRFDKVALVEWRHERLTVDETLQELGVSKAMLHQWARQRKLTVLKDMGGGHRWFLRDQVEQLRESVRGGTPEALEHCPPSEPGDATSVEH